MIWCKSQEKRPHCGMSQNMNLLHILAKNVMIFCWNALKHHSEVYHFSICFFTEHYCCFCIPKRYQWQTSVTPFNAWPKMVLLMLAITCSVRPPWLLPSVRPPWLLPPPAICKTEVICKYQSEICHHGIELVWKDTKTAQQWQLVKLLVLWGSKITLTCSVRPTVVSVP